MCKAGKMVLVLSEPPIQRKIKSYRDVFIKCFGDSEKV